MEAILKSLCDQHELSCIAVSLLSRHERGVTVYLHWDFSWCVGGHGDTFDEALADALGQMAVIRSPTVEAAA